MLITHEADVAEHARARRPRSATGASSDDRLHGTAAGRVATRWQRSAGMNALEALRIGGCRACVANRCGRR